MQHDFKVKGVLSTMGVDLMLIYPVMLNSHCTGRTGQGQYVCFGTSVQLITGATGQWKAADWLLRMSKLEKSYVNVIISPTLLF